MGVPVVAFIIVAAAFLLIVLGIGAVGIRRLHLRRILGTFEASMCHPPGRWRMGVCRYTDTHLEWLRLFSLSPVPRYRFVRSALVLKGRRAATDEERLRVPPGTVIAVIEYRGEDVLMAMTLDVYAGLSSWLEAGPVVGIGTWR